MEEINKEAANAKALDATACSPPVFMPEVPTIGMLQPWMNLGHSSEVAEQRYQQLREICGNPFPWVNEKAH
jgi:hypothetical protein